MPTTVFDEVYNQQGQLISSTPRTRPDPVVSAADVATAKQTIKTMVSTFYVGGAPTGSPTNAQLRNWLLSVSVLLRDLYKVLDNE